MYNYFTSFATGEANNLLCRTIYYVDCLPPAVLSVTLARDVCGPLLTVASSCFIHHTNLIHFFGNSYAVCRDVYIWL